jgi:hypothetical protein
MPKYLSVALFSTAVISGCAHQKPLAGDPPQVQPPLLESSTSLESNRFEMTQRGRQMRADDFDAWMKARGIRIAKGVPAVETAPVTQTKAK